MSIDVGLRKVIRLHMPFAFGFTYLEGFQDFLSYLYCLGLPP